MKDLLELAKKKCDLGKRGLQVTWGDVVDYLSKKIEKVDTSSTKVDGIDMISERQAREMFGYIDHNFSYTNKPMLEDATIENWKSKGYIK